MATLSEQELAMNTPREDADQAQVLREWQERHDSGEGNCLDTVVGIVVIVLLIAASVIGHALVSAGMV